MEFQIGAPPSLKTPTPECRVGYVRMRPTRLLRIRPLPPLAKPSGAQRRTRIDLVD
jgi:hypothetical protein